jgi:protein TonB
MASSFTLAAFTYETPLMNEDQLAYDQGSDSKFEVVAQEKPEEKPEESEDVKDEDEETQENPGETDENLDLTKIKKDKNKIVKVKSKVKKPKGIKFGKVKIGDEDTIHDFVDVEAEFPGGYIAMTKFIADNYEIPFDAEIIGDQGKVYVNFVVEKDGSISNVKIGQSVSTSIDREAKRVVRSFPKWKPGEVDYLKVRTRVSLPIVVTFQ